MAFVARLLHLEGLAIGAAAIWLYFAETDLNWIWLGVLFLAPDVAFVAVVFSRTAAVRAYNVTHAYVLPVGLGVAGFASGEEVLLGLALIWFAHIGIDRFVGYGLKYSLAPKSTHLQRAAQPGPATDNSDEGDAAPTDASVAAGEPT